MITITAIITAKQGHAEMLRDALQAVADHVARNEPKTIGFHVSQSLENPLVFTTYERFEDELAMEQHNGSDAVASFFETVKGSLDGDATLHICRELNNLAQASPV